MCALYVRVGISLINLTFGLLSHKFHQMLPNAVFANSALAILYRQSPKTPPLSTSRCSVTSVRTPHEVLLSDETGPERNVLDIHTQCYGTK